MIAIMTSYLIRYLLPYRLRNRLFIRDVSQIWNALPVYIDGTDIATYTMQVDILQEYFRL